MNPDEVTPQMLAKSDGELTQAGRLLDELIDTWKQRQFELDLAEIRDPTLRLTTFLHEDVVHALIAKYGHPEATAWWAYTVAVAVTRLAGENRSTIEGIDLNA